MPKENKGKEKPKEESYAEKAENFLDRYRRAIVPKKEIDPKKVTMK